jgi:hypothetical protein
MTLLKLGKAHSALRDDVNVIACDYVHRLKAKNSIMKRSLSLIQEAVMSVRVKNFERAEDIIFENNANLNSVQLIDYDLSTYRFSMSKITGIENEFTALENVMKNSGELAKVKDQLISEIHQAAFQSDKYLDEISQAFENEITTQKKDIDSLSRVEDLRNKIILPLKIE